MAALEDGSGTETVTTPPGPPDFDGKLARPGRGRQRQAQIAPAAKCAIANPQDFVADPQARARRAFLDGPDLP